MLSKITLRLLVSALIIISSLGTTIKGYSNQKNYSLTISIDKDYSFRIFDDFELSSSKGSFKATQYIDSITKLFTLHWTNLPQDTYTLKLTTVFADLKEYNINLKEDTTLTLTDFYQLHNVNTLTKNNFENSKDIKIYYRTSGCFHSDKQILLIEKQNENDYLCTLIKDSTAYKDTMGLTKIIIIPVYQKKYINGRIINDLFKVVNRSQILQEDVHINGEKCISTTHKQLYILNDNQLFQFYDFGICNWNMYQPFVTKYFR